MMKLCVSSQKHAALRVHSTWTIIVALFLCASILTVIVGTYATPCRLKSPDSPCKFKRGWVLKTMETSLAVVSNLEQPCDDAVIIAADDVASNLASQIPYDVRLDSEFGTRATPIYLQHLSFLC